MKLKQRIIQLLVELNKDVFEKEEVIKLSFLSAIAGESIFLLGAPGVAKSLIARRLKFAFDGGNSFEYLMNRFSTPDEIFGPVSIKKLKDDDKYERLTEKYLPNANIVFLDEIWKAGPSIQNSLLTILNEKIYRNGEQEVNCDIRGLISASNELPEKNQGLDALWDRFLVRMIVEGVSEKENFNKMISEKLHSYKDNIPTNLKIKNEEYLSWSNEIDDVIIPEEVFDVIHFVRAKVQEFNTNNDTPIYISDRRWRKVIRLLRSSAFLNGRHKVDLMDCFLISYCVWNEPEQLANIKEIISSVLKEHGYALSLNLKAISTQISEFESEEVKNATLIIRDYEEVVNHESPIGYYEIIGLKHQIQFNKIKIEDYNKISEIQQLLPFYDLTSTHSHNMKVHWTQGVLKIASNQWDNCSIKTKTVKKQEITSKPPTALTKKTWDNNVLDLKATIQAQIQKVEDYRNGSLASLRTNIFVDSSLASLVENNLNQTIYKLQEMIIDLEKIKDYYDNLK